MAFTHLNKVRLAALTSVTLAGATFTPPIATAASAQALEPVVSVCSGITLPRSAVTEIIGAVNEPIVGQVENTANSLTDVRVLLDPLLNIPDVDIDLDSILADAAEGDPITLQVLDTDGNLVTAADSCNLTADAITLDDEAGIAIGGNQITGLGADGQTASAGEIDAIAFGNGANTADGAGGAIAIGTNASATAANSVALGAGSLADRGAVAGYTAPFLEGEFDSVGSVSVGSADGLRQITNVAPGTAATDAATVGQVQGAFDAVGVLADSAVLYDNDAQTSVTLAGAGGTTVTNVADGTLGATSSDAVNGSQLFETNQALAALDDNAVQYDDETKAAITLGGADGTTIGNLADGELSATSTEAVNGSQLFATNQQVATNTSDIADLQDGIAGSAADIAELQDSAVFYDDDTHDTVTLDGEAGTTIDNLADGTLAADSAQAVNGSQLYETNQAVAANTDDITDIQTDIGDIDARVTTNTTNITTLQQQVANVPVRYVQDGDGTTPSATPTNTVALIAQGGGAATLTNVAAGDLAAGSTDAVNGSQLYATNVQVTQNTADIVTINNNLAGSTVVAVQYSNPGTPTRSNGGTITNDVTLIGANANAPVALHNVADGVAPTDAANMGQLQSGLDRTLTAANDYTDQRIDNLDFDLGRSRRDAFSGTAAAMALTSIPQTIEPGKSMIGGGIGHYRGQTAFAIGASTTFSDGAAVAKAGATMDTHGKGGFAAGAGFAF
ncbi:MAG: YadA-like family protein [Candidatus Andeanibacterium colombiense]|uniref:YadA-like family protein n=1 Tax=Candidatus Andeanibacterium colombiense TaxID=3121345 RepID=A0AAJ5X4D9_9SPHN|nr:MAG: YadA-like family protein [Sphingomonadaceae bacterium]